jgi:hypothetical protein
MKLMRSGQTIPMDAEGNRTRQGASLYGARPHLNPDNIAADAHADARMMQAIGEDDPRHHIGDVAAVSDHNQGSEAERRRHWAEAIAVGAAVRFNDPNSAMHYQQTHAQADVQRARRHLRSELGAFDNPNLASLTEDQLRRVGLSPQDIADYRSLQYVLPPGQRPENIEGSLTPPLYLKQLAADVINFNNQSVIPRGGVVSRIAGPNRYDRDLSGQDSKEVADTVGRYMANLLGIDTPPSGAVLGALIEIDLAGSQNFAQQPPHIQNRILDRMEQVLPRVKPSDVPLPAQEQFNRYYQRLVARKPELAAGNKLSQLKNRFGRGGNGNGNGGNHDI